jgi:hypothetical protein
MSFWMTHNSQNLPFGVEIAICYLCHTALCLRNSISCSLLEYANPLVFFILQVSNIQPESKKIKFDED